MCSKGACRNKISLEVCFLSLYFCRNNLFSQTVFKWENIHFLQKLQKLFTGQSHKFIKSLKTFWEVKSFYSQKWSIRSFLQSIFFLKEVMFKETKLALIFYLLLLCSCSNNQFKDIDCHFPEYRMFAETKQVLTYPFHQLN